eukprot:928219-Pelagomonas_calceolata.AAC.3
MVVHTQKGLAKSTHVRHTFHTFPAKQLNKGHACMESADHAEQQQADHLAAGCSFAARHCPPLSATQAPWLYK